MKRRQDVMIGDSLADIVSTIRIRVVDAGQNKTGEIILDVPHSRQRQTWDCGLACLLMALAYLNPSEEHMTYDDIVDQLGGLTSIWTIDLALLLGKIIGTDRFAFCTSTVGVKETYRLIDFYKKELDSDAVRVNRLFKEASANGVNVVHRTLSSNSIRDLLLSGQVVIIMLIDLSHLKKDMDSEVYRGHFILLCGYRHETAEFAYQDPASADGHVCFVKVDTLDTARKSEGTDEDLLIIRTTSTLTEAETAEDEADHGRVVRCCK